MRTAVQWVLSLTSSARPSTSGPRQAAQNLSEPNENVETFRDKSRGPAPLASHGQESTVNPGTEATGDHLQTSSCPVVGQLGNGRQAILPTFSEEGSSNYRQSHAEDLQSIPEDVQSLSPVDKQASAEVQGSTPEEVGL